MWVILLLLGSVLYLAKNFILLILRQHVSPLRLLPGPASPSLFMGNLGQMHDQENTNLIARWSASYGANFVYRGFIGGCRLMTLDTTAIAYILGNAYEYPKPDFLRESLATMAAGHEGLLTVEGEDHKRQRKILTPAFSSTHIKSLAPLFLDTAEQLRDIFKQMAVDQPKRVDVLIWLSRATLDIIGQAGFGYTFNALGSASLSPASPVPSSATFPVSDSTNAEMENENELARAFSVIFSTARKFRVMVVLEVWFPFLRRFRRNNATMQEARATMRRIGLELIEQRKTEVITEIQATKDGRRGATGIDGDKTVLGRDLLSVLIRSNLTSSPTAQMSIPEILCQTSTFIAAGHETTASALSWTLLALAQSPLSQSRLREALMTLPPAHHEDFQSALDRLPYLDYTIRESLRVHAPVTNTMRVCMKDGGDIIPTAEPYIGSDGIQRRGIEVKKWDIISIPIQAVNKSVKIWGEDAGIFRPERWEHLPEETNAIPGLYSNILTFLNGNPVNGNRACIGYKFALLEMKIFIYVLIRDLEFSIDPSLVVEKKLNVVTRPFVKSEPHLGNQMPLNVRPVTESTPST